MTNIGLAIREEICRLARREIKSQTSSMKQAVTQYRREIARLKRQIKDQEKKIAFLEKQERKRLEQPESTDEAENIRFSARSVKAQRQRLGFSAADYAKLIGVSTLTVYNWEHGKSRPRKEQLAALVALRGIGKREALTKLELLDAQEKKKAARRKK